MIRFKLCKKYNTVEVEYGSVDEIELSQLEAIYGILPDYVDTDAEKPKKKKKKKPSEAQIKLAQKLKIDPSDMDMEELRIAIKKAMEKD